MHPQTKKATTETCDS